MRPIEEIDSGKDYCKDDCRCYVRPCTNVKCAKDYGKCVMPGQIPPSSKYYSLNKNSYCDKTRKCLCYKPKCVNSTCTKLGGICVISGDKEMTSLTNGKPLLKKKKKVMWCNKKLNCKCMIKGKVTLPN